MTVQKEHPETVMKMVVERLMSGFRLQEAPYIGNVGENDARVGIPSCSLYMAFSFDSLLGFASPNQLL